MRRQRNNKIVISNGVYTHIKKGQIFKVSFIYKKYFLF